MEHVLFGLDAELWWEFCFPPCQSWLDRDYLLEEVRARTLLIETGSIPVVVLVDCLDDICYYLVQFALIVS